MGGLCLCAICVFVASEPARLDQLQEKVTRLEEELSRLTTEVTRLKEAQAGEGKESSQFPFKWQLGGQWRVMVNASDFTFHQQTIGDERSRVFVNQRLRTFLWVSPAESVESYFQVEMGHIPWGENFEYTKSFTGPRYPASVDPNGDRIGIELRRAYLTYRGGELGDLRVGIQGWNDLFYGRGMSLQPAGVDDYRVEGTVLADSVWDFNVGGVTYWRKCSELGDLEVRLGWYALFRQGDSLRPADSHLTAWDMSLPCGEQLSVGFSLYYLYDTGTYAYPTRTSASSFYKRAQELWVGLRAGGQVACLPWNAFVIYNTGWRDDRGTRHATWEHTGGCGRIEVGPLEIGPGAASVQSLVATGDRDRNDRNSRQFRTIAQSERDGFGGQTYYSYLFLTTPHGPSDVNDLGVSPQNRGLGLWTVQGKYDYPIWGILSGRAVVGYLRSFAANPTNGNWDMGVEFGNSFTLCFCQGVTLTFGGAFLATGSFYEGAGGDPDDGWEVFARAQVEL